ncbi:MAG: substrate-binding domain-containing protein [Acidimicrobiales bacterium]
MNEPGRQRKILALSLAGLLAVLIIATFLSSNNNSGQQEEATQDAVNSPVTITTTAPLLPCRDASPVELDLTVSTEKSELLEQFAERYNQIGRLDDGRCVEVLVSKVTSGLAQSSLAAGWESAGPEGVPKPQAWSPTSSIWAGLLEQRWQEQDETPTDENGGALLDQLGSVAQSPMSIAMRKPMAEALGWPDEPIGWNDVLGLIDAEGGWASVGHPEWGDFTMGKDNPLRSTSGMAASVAAYYAAPGRPAEITLDHVADPDVREFVAGVERGVIRYSDEATKFLARLAEAEAQASPDDAPFISAALIQEQLVYLYNTGNPRGERLVVENGGGEPPAVTLVAISPADGTLMMDHPFVLLPWASNDQREVAEGFHDFILQPEQQNEFLNWGFRDANGVAGDLLANKIDLPTKERPTVVEAPSADIVRRILDDWSELRKKVRVLIVYDVSGTMEFEVAPNRTRNQAAQEAAIASLNELSNDDEVGLWLFSDESRWGALPYSEVVRPAAIRTGKAALVDAIDNIFVGGDTALYRTIRAATSELRENYDSELINTILVLSDGENDDRDDDLAQLIADLDAGTTEEPVRVFAIAFDKDSDLRTLTQIAEATGGAAFDARDPDTIEDVFIDVISNF